MSERIWINVSEMAGIDMNERILLRIGISFSGSLGINKSERTGIAMGEMIGIHLSERIGIMIWEDRD